MSNLISPHVPAAFINSIREEGTEAEACDYLQTTWNDLCAVTARLAKAEARAERLLAALEVYENALTEAGYIQGLLAARQAVRDQKLNAADHSRKRNEGFLQGVAWCESAIDKLIAEALLAKDTP